VTTGFAASIVNNWLDTDFATNWIKLHTADPGSAGTTAAAAGDATRKQATMGSASAGSKAMTSMSGSWTNVTTTETLADISVWTASTAGTFKGSCALTAPQAWVNTNTFSLTSFSVAISPIAA
jgi:hypothetical protein